MFRFKQPHAGNFQNNYSPVYHLRTRKRIYWIQPLLLGKWKNHCCPQANAWGSTSALHALQNCIKSCKPQMLFDRQFHQVWGQGQKFCGSGQGPPAFWGPPPVDFYQPNVTLSGERYVDSWLLNALKVNTIMIQYSTESHCHSWRVPLEWPEGSPVFTYFKDIKHMACRLDLITAGVVSGLWTAGSLLLPCLGLWLPPVCSSGNSSSHP